MTALPLHDIMRQKKRFILLQQNLTILDDGCSKHWQVYFNCSPSQFPVDVKDAQTSEPHPATVEILRLWRTTLPRGFSLWFQAPHSNNPSLHLFDLCLWVLSCSLVLDLWVAHQVNQMLLGKGKLAYVAFYEIGIFPPEMQSYASIFLKCMFPWRILCIQITMTHNGISILNAALKGSWNITADTCLSKAELNITV